MRLLQGRRTAAGELGLRPLRSAIWSSQASLEALSARFVRRLELLGTQPAD